MSSLAWTDNIPARDQVVRLGSVVCEVRRRNVGMVSSNLLSLSYGEIVRKDISSSDGLLPESFETYNVIKRGDIVLRLTDLQNDKRSLRSGLVPEDGIITSAYTTVRPVAIDPRFMAYQLRAIDLAKTLYSLGGGLRQSLGFDDIKTLYIALPSADEQRQIADYLDHETAEIDAFIADLRELVELADSRLVAHVNHLTAQPDSAGATADGVALSRVLPERVDYRGATPMKVDDGVQLLTARNVKMGWIDYDTSREFVAEESYAQVMSRGLPRRGDILFTMEAPLGNVALVDRERVALAQRLVKFRPAADIDPEYICFAMQSASFQDQLRSLATGSTVLGIKASKLNQLRFVVPALSIQRRIANDLGQARDRTTALRTDIDTVIALANERRAALITAAVTGQIDVTTRPQPAVDSIQSALEEAR